MTITQENVHITANKRLNPFATLILAVGLMLTCVSSGSAWAGVPTNVVLPIYDSSPVVRQSPYYTLDVSTEQIQAGHCPKVMADLHQALEKDPVNLFTNFDLGFCYMQMAQVSMDTAKINRPVDHQKRIVALLKKAEYYFQRVQNLNPELSVTYFKLGKVALMMRNSRQAEAYYQQGLDYNPQSAALAFNLARVYDQDGQNARAIGLYHRAIALDPDFVYAYNNLGLLYEQEKNYKEAERVYKAALKRDPSYNFARLNLGNLYAETERLSEAKSLYQEALRLEPNNSWAHLYLGNIYFMLSDFERATASYQASVKSNPAFSTGYYLLAVSLSKQERVDEALSASLQYMSLEPDGKYAEQMKHLIVALKLQKSGTFYVEQVNRSSQ